ncbi:hypothetical protein CASFOL_037248 [Castilleja foliolosa]|uniref:Uncharacterized protein n=1 Tax=Castilleja foliolosa TaxID=1961234 RepID=A0ABD3BNI0_9LAMI
MNLISILPLHTLSFSPDRPTLIRSNPAASTSISSCLMILLSPSSATASTCTMASFCSHLHLTVRHDLILAADSNASDLIRNIAAECGIDF